MPLAEYLALEQAREDVKALLAQPSQPLGELAPDSEARIGSVRTAPLAVTWSDYKHKGCAWRQVELDHADGCLSVYYRPDGDRYVVTDLGEGVRALRLRGASIQRLGDAISEVLGAMWVANQLPPRYGITGMVNGEIAPMSSITAADLPDALCRVMLASLRVAQS